MRQRVAVDSRNGHPLRSKLWVAVSEAERERILQRAAEVGTTASTYLRCVAVGEPLRSITHHQRVQRVLDVHADLGRYMGLLKLWLSRDPKTDGFDRSYMHRLIQECAETQGVLRAVARSAMRQPRSLLFVAPGEPLQGKRDRQIQVYLSCIEKQAVMAEATHASLSLSAFVRGRGLGFQPHEGISEAGVAAFETQRDALRPLGHLLKLYLADDKALATYPRSQVRAAVKGSLLEATRVVGSLGQASKPRR